MQADAGQTTGAAEESLYAADAVLKLWGSQDDQFYLQEAIRMFQEEYPEAAGWTIDMAVISSAVLNIICSAVALSVVILYSVLVLCPDRALVSPISCIFLVQEQIARGAVYSEVPEKNKKNAEDFGLIQILW